MGHVRGLDRKDIDVPPPSCAAMAVGSVPLTDPAEAVSLILRSTPEIPAWPQLPRRSFLENMYVQFSEGLPGLVLDRAQERLYVLDEVPPDDLIRFVEQVEADDPDAFAISPDYAAGLPAMLEAVAGSRPPYIKGQVTGPVSFGLTVTFAGPARPPVRRHPARSHHGLARPESPLAGADPPRPRAQRSPAHHGG